VDFNHGLNAAVNKLRETLSDSAEEPKYIETLPRRGYRFIGKIENAVSAAAIAVAASQPTARAQTVQPPPVPMASVAAQTKAASAGSAPVRAKRRLRWAPLAISAAVLVAGGAIMGPPAWSPDGQSIIFSSTRAGEPSLWRIPANGGIATPLDKAGTATWHPTISTKDGKLVVQKILRASGIYRVELREGGTKRTKTIVTSTNGRNEGPLLSPDGRRLLFMSDRSGGLEIWVSNRDGSSPIQLTNLHGCGTPRWSPDGQWVVFDAGGAAAQGIYIVSAFGGAPRALLTDGFENSVPNWSRDGQWIYFGSKRSGKDQLWIIRASGGHAVQVTTGGGFSGWESEEGKTIYYAKRRTENPEIRQIPITGGTEQIVSSTIRPKSWAAWAVTSKGIYFCPNAEAGTAPSVDFYDFQTRLARQLTLLEKSPFWLSVSADGSEMFYDQAGQDGSSILLVESYK
jgi:Tol biopolymer transport system component